MHLLFKQSHFKIPFAALSFKWLLLPFILHLRVNSSVSVRQARVRESLGLIEKNITTQINHSFGSGTTPIWQGTTHSPPHSLIIGSESRGSPLPMG
jgi:hypothetical protein